ncbi:MAG TPA: cytochrome d ubiquinol oxidase subunit II [Bacteroidetes bacterium]|nr:cytochrome d ubiquinol oxidase subunit II [Bacteroidota bacterium]
MFLSISYEFLQQYWWIIISVLGAALVFLLFVQGGQTFMNSFKGDNEKTLILNATGHKWELTFTTLVTFGGAFFASFPLFYSTSFGGAYWVWILILFAFIVQAVSYEYRKRNNVLGQKTFEVFLYLNGILAPILLGAAVSTFFTGSAFSIEKLNLLNLASSDSATISQWQSPYHGLEAVWTTENLAFIQNLSLGLAVFFLSRVLALLYFKNIISNENIENKIPKLLKTNTVLFLVFFLFWLIRLMFISGFAVNNDGTVFMEKYKYLHNLLDMPIVLILLLIGVVLVLWGIYKGIFTESKTGFWYSGAGTVITVITLFLIAGFNNTAYYPSTYDLNSSLTIYNSSSSPYTLGAMAIVSLMVPFVIAYIVWAWKAIDSKKLSTEELESESHVY